MLPGIPFPTLKEPLLSSPDIVCKRQYIPDEGDNHKKDEQPVRLTPIRVDGKIFIGSGEDANIITEQADA